jgi:hypothetical protein
MMLSPATSFCLILSSLLVLSGIWLWKTLSGPEGMREGMREGLNKERSKELAEHTQAQREEAVHGSTTRIGGWPGTTLG